MKLIVGLGNPGTSYENTRHNIGFMVVDKLAREIGESSPVWEEDQKRNALVTKIGGVMIVKPMTFMNNSGIAVAALARFYKIHEADVWVIHDDIDLPIGKIRIRKGGGTGGHNGVDSIIKSLGNDAFIRVRLGVGRGKKEKMGEEEGERKRHRSVVDFVLSRFTEHEAGDLKKLIKHGTEAVRIALIEGLDKAMNRFN